MTTTTYQARGCADLYRATSSPVAASIVYSLCNQLDASNESIYALTLALEVERDAANLYAKQVAHWIGKHDALLEQQLTSKPVKQCLNCLHYNEPLASANCASCIHGGNVEDNFVALGNECE